MLSPRKNFDALFAANSNVTLTTDLNIPTTVASGMFGLDDDKPN
jgi:hypothetical protein